MIDVKEALKSAEDKMKKSANFLEAELSRIRAGRANLAILDSVRVMSYGQPLPLTLRTRSTCMWQPELDCTSFTTASSVNFGTRTTARLRMPM